MQIRLIAKGCNTRTRSYILGRMPCVEPFMARKRCAQRKAARWTRRRCSSAPPPSLRWQRVLSGWLRRRCRTQSSVSCSCDTAARLRRQLHICWTSGRMEPFEYTGPLLMSYKPESNPRLLPLHARAAQEDVVSHCGTGWCLRLPQFGRH